MSSHIYDKLNLYRRRGFWASAAIVLAGLALAASAAPFQHRSSHKLRATALVEVTTAPGGAVTTHVFPITILAEGTFRDASIYESRPRPMALANGVVYEVQKTGVPVGYVTINNGGHTLEGWVAEGRWQSVAQLQARSAPKPAARPQSPPPDERPILHREGENPQPTPTPAPDQTQKPPSATPDDDRPVLHRSGDSGQQPSPSSAPPAGQSPSPQPTPVPAPDETQSPSSTPDNDRPVLHRSGDSGQQPTPSATPPASQPANQPATQPNTEPPAAEDPNRPVLRHRTSSTDEIRMAPASVASKAGSPSPSSRTVTSATSITHTPGTQTLVAVSDTQFTDTRSYEYYWKPAEQEQIEAKMRKLALAQLPGENAQANDHAMTNVVIRSFDLDLSNDAVVVITAEVPGGNLPPPGKTSRASTAAAKAQQDKSKPVSRYVTVIARVDIDGNPQKLAASVTDSSRLDVAPRLELIDAVDVDGDGLAELVFREYDFDQKTFIIYGVGHGTVTKVFEGASEPIK
jgi:hypothetical protein